MIANVATSQISKRKKEEGIDSRPTFYLMYQQMLISY